MSNFDQQSASTYRQVPVSSSDSRSTPVKVTPAGNLTRVGLVFHSIVILEPIRTAKPDRSDVS